MKLAQREKKERGMHILFLLCGLLTVSLLLAILLFLLHSGLPALRKIGPLAFLFGKCWASTATPPAYGILPFLLTSLAGMLGAILLGLPIGLGAALYLSKFASGRRRFLLETVIHLLAGIPSVIFGLVGMLVLVPAIRQLFDVPDGSGLLASILVLTVMILPSLIKMATTALDAVPKAYEEASLALGASPLETYWRVSLPAAKSGLAAAVVLALGRAMGEAMAVMMVAGNAPNLPDSLFQSVRFLTTAIASEMSYAAGLQREALFSIALVLFLFLLGVNGLVHHLLKKTGPRQEKEKQEKKAFPPTLPSERGTGEGRKRLLSSPDEAPERLEAKEAHV